MARKLLASDGVRVAIALLASVALGTLSRALLAATVTVVDDAADAQLAIAGVGHRGDAVVGTITNRGLAEVRDVRLLIDIAFLWANEVAPGDDNPGRAIVTTVPGPIPTNGTVEFFLTPNPPLEPRIDGRYADPRVRIMGYTAIGGAAAN